MEDAVKRLNEVRQRIEAAAQAAGRNAAEVTLVAVSKTFEAGHITPIIAAGQRVFGENRVQEAKVKWPALRAAARDIELHLIGPLQSNKVKEAVALFDVIQTVDRPKIAQALAAEMERAGKRLPCFVQVNTGDEDQKAGIDPLHAAAFVEQCRGLGLKIEGLMCIPPVEEEAALHFALLRKLAGEAGVANLSMGMSGDFEKAIAHGATHIRVGSAIFGTRG